MTANEFYFNPENVPELRHVLPQQYTEIGQGAQFRVYMLTDPDLSRSELPDDEYVVPRVVKESLNSYETALYVRDKIGITDPLEQAEKVAQLTMADFSELSNNRLRVEESIANKEWEQVHNQRESSQLPPYLFDYFCDQLDIRFNSLIRAEWGTGIASRLDMLAHPMLRPMHDVERTVLWNARPGRNLHTSIAAIDPDLDSTVGILAYRRVQERLLYEPPAFIFEQGIA